MSVHKTELETIAEVGRLIGRVKASWWYRWFASNEVVDDMNKASQGLSFMYYCHSTVPSMGDELKENK